MLCSPQVWLPSVHSIVATSLPTFLMLCLFPPVTYSFCNWKPCIPQPPSPILLLSSSHKHRRGHKKCVVVVVFFLRMCLNFSVQGLCFQTLPIPVLNPAPSRARFSRGWHLSHIHCSHPFTDSPRKEVYFMAIIDILTHYDAKKKAAHAAKTVKHGVSISTLFPSLLLGP